MIKIYHLIYSRGSGGRRSLEYTALRKDFDFKKKEMKGGKIKIVTISNFHMETLAGFYHIWVDCSEEMNEGEIIEFTYGVDEESGISAIAIKHPRDNYNKKIGRKIVEGRIKRMKGEIEGREPYDLNEFFLVYKEE